MRAAAAEAVGPWPVPVGQPTPLPPSFVMGAVRAFLGWLGGGWCMDTPPHAQRSHRTERNMRTYTSTRINICEAVGFIIEGGRSRGVK